MGTASAECRHALYELNKTCSADIPERGEFYTFDEYLSDRIEIPTYHPGGVVLARQLPLLSGPHEDPLRMPKGFSTGSSAEGALGEGPEPDELAGFGSAVILGRRTSRPKGLVVHQYRNEVPQHRAAS